MNKNRILVLKHWNFAMSNSKHNKSTVTFFQTFNNYKHEHIKKQSEFDWSSWSTT